MSRDLALFDFDGTLTRGDSMLPFLRAAIGPVALTRALAATSPWLVGYAAGLIRNESAKERLLSASLGGRAIADLQAKGRAFARDDVPELLRETMMAEFRRRRDEGRICVLVSASLDLYLEPWARDAGFEHVISSRLAVDEVHRATGALLGGNCHGQEKVVRIRDWLSTQDEIGHCVAYGDTSGDAPMLALADEGFWVGKDGRLTPNRDS